MRTFRKPRKVRQLQLWWRQHKIKGICQPPANSFTLDKPCLRGSPSPRTGDRRAVPFMLHRLACPLGGWAEWRAKMRSACLLVISIALGASSQAQTYVESILHNFGTTSTDGANPYGGLVMDSNGNIYGTTYNGGGSANCSGGCGTVFKLSASGQQSILHAFTGLPTGDGANPSAALTIDKSGNL